MLEFSFRHAFLLWAFLLEQWSELLEEVRGILEEIVRLLELRLIPDF